jgi:hypothetical protein
VAAPKNPNNKALVALIKKQARRRKAQRRRRAALKAKGLCHRCQSPVGPKRIGLNLCADCNKKGTGNYNAWRNRKIEAWKALGLCVHCQGKREAMPGTSICAYCAENDYEVRCARIKILKEQGICARCCDPDAVHGFFKSTGKRKKYCIKCLNKYNNEKRALKRQTGRAA